MAEEKDEAFTAIGRMPTAWVAGTESATRQEIAAGLAQNEQLVTTAFPVDPHRLAGAVEAWCSKATSQLGPLGTCELRQHELQALLWEARAKQQYVESYITFVIAREVLTAQVTEGNKEDVALANRMMFFDQWEKHAFCEKLPTARMRFEGYAPDLPWDIFTAMLAQLKQVLYRIDHELKRFMTIDAMDSRRDVAARIGPYRTEQGLPSSRTTPVGERGPRARNREEFEKVKLLFHQGKGVSEISKATSAPRRTVERWLKQLREGRC